MENDILDIEQFKKWRPEFKNATFDLENGKYICGIEIEKMSKSFYNVVNPDVLIEKYGADTLRLYEMFLGPIEQYKPWDTKGIEGVSRFIKKFWRLFFDTNGNFSLSEDAPKSEELKILHKTIHKIEEDIERFSLNTTISAFMICINELTDLKCNKRSILEPLLILIAPFAPHFAEELWNKAGHTTSIHLEQFPKFNAKYIIEDTFNVRFLSMAKCDLQCNYQVLQHKTNYSNSFAGRNSKMVRWQNSEKVIVIPKKIVNIVI